MPPKPGPHLDLYLVPPEGVPLVEDVLDRLEALGVAAGRAPGSRATDFVEGGYSGVRVERRDTDGLYANGQGGFRVRCPETGENVVPAFQEARKAWRDGGEAVLRVCPSCGRSHRMGALDYAPPAAVGRGAVVLSGVACAELTEAGLARLTAALGPLRVVGSRR